ncbi:hypothetical protein HDU98_008462 [Podochytrium sp. JEL0797]|nr:hypothetical protein HDU98_008462 [Podochytrium sp. JEL0797]
MIGSLLVEVVEYIGDHRKALGTGDAEDEDLVEALASVVVGRDVDFERLVRHREKEAEENIGALVGGKLKDYQIQGMGVWKAIQEIAFVEFLIEHARLPGPFLVIVPLSTAANWLKACEKCATSGPKIKAILYHEDANERKQAAKNILGSNFQLVITAYEYVINEKKVLSRPN